jgi:hypothetical protein
MIDEMNWDMLISNIISFMMLIRTESFLSQWSLQISFFLNVSLLVKFSFTSDQWYSVIDFNSEVFQNDINLCLKQLNQNFGR